METNKEIIKEKNSRLMEEITKQLIRESAEKTIKQIHFYANKKEKKWLFLDEALACLKSNDQDTALMYLDEMYKRVAF